MGKTSSKSISGTELRAPKYRNPINFESDLEGALVICSRKLKNPETLNHHMIVLLQVSDNLLRVFEWGTGSCDYFDAYATKSLEGEVKVCQRLPRRVKISDVYSASKAESSNKYDVLKNNCGHWVERVCKRLGEDVTVNSTCNSCQKLYF